MNAAGVAEKFAFSKTIYCASTCQLNIKHKNKQRISLLSHFI